MSDAPRLARSSRSGGRRIVFVDHAATPGGGQLALLWLLENSPQLDAHVIFLTPGPLLARFREAGIPTSVVSPQPFDPRVLVTALPTLAAQIARRDADAVVATSIAAAKSLAFVPLRVPRLIYLQEDLARGFGRGLTTHVLFRTIYPAFDGFIANSEWTASTIPVELTEVPHAVAYPPSHAKRLPRSRVFAEDGVVRIATFSRPERWKGLDLVVDAAELLMQDPSCPAFRVDMFGGGAVMDEQYARELRRRVDAGPLPIRLHGHVDDVGARLAETDVVVLPSRLPEPFGQVVAQARAAGAVVVISDAGGAMEQITPGLDGLSFERGSASALAERLRSLLSDPLLGTTLSAAGLADAARWGDDVLAARFTRALDSLCDDVRGSRRLRRRAFGLVRPWRSVRAGGVMSAITG